MGFQAQQWPINNAIKKPKEVSRPLTKGRIINLHLNFVISKHRKERIKYQRHIKSKEILNRATCNKDHPYIWQIYYTPCFNTTSLRSEKKKTKPNLSNWIRTASKFSGKKKDLRKKGTQESCQLRIRRHVWREQTSRWWKGWACH